MPRLSPPTRYAAALLLGGVLTLTAALPAAAHDELVSSDPADRATLDQPPAQIVLTFAEPAVALGTRLVVTGPSGPVQQGDPQLVGDTVVQALAPGSPAGAYTVDWRVTSDDGHPVSGSLTFTATGAGTAGSPAPVPAPTTPVSTDGRGTRVAWLWLVVAAGVVGSAAVVTRARRRSAQARPGGDR